MNRIKRNERLAVAALLACLAGVGALAIVGSRTSIVQEGSIDGWWSTPDQGTCRFHLVPDVGPGAKHWSDAQRGDICQGGQPHSYIIRKDANGVLKLEVADRR